MVVRVIINKLVKVEVEEEYYSCGGFSETLQFENTDCYLISLYYYYQITHPPTHLCTFAYLFIYIDQWGKGVIRIGDLDSIIKYIAIIGITSVFGWFPFVFFAVCCLLMHPCLAVAYRLVSYTDLYTLYKRCDRCRAKYLFLAQSINQSINRPRTHY